MAPLALEIQVKNDFKLSHSFQHYIQKQKLHLTILSTLTPSSCLVFSRRKGLSITGLLEATTTCKHNHLKHNHPLTITRGTKLNSRPLWWWGVVVGR